MSFKQFGAAVLGAVAMAAANATPITFPTSGDPTFGSFAGTASDSFTFSVGIGNVLEFGLTTSGGLNIDSLVAVGPTALNFTHVLDTPIFDSFSLAGPVPLLAGLYTITVTTTGNGFYSGGLNLLNPPVAAPVPEPETYAMLLAGLGAIGFMARRRQAK